MHFTVFEILTLTCQKIKTSHDLDHNPTLLGAPALRASFGAFGPSIVSQPEILDPPLGAPTIWKILATPMRANNLP